jgi:nucleoporin NDC1
MHKKAYALADILRTSVYQIIAAFGEEMVVGSGSGKGVAIAERDWLSQTTPLYGTHEMHLQKLGLFLEYRVN